MNNNKTIKEFLSLINSTLINSIKLDLPPSEAYNLILIKLNLKNINNDLTNNLKKYVNTYFDLFLYQRCLVHDLTTII